MWFWWGRHSSTTLCSVARIQSQRKGSLSALLVIWVQDVGMLRKVLSFSNVLMLKRGQWLCRFSELRAESWWGFFVEEKREINHTGYVYIPLPGRQGNVLELPLSLKDFWDELEEGGSK